MPQTDLVSYKVTFNIRCVVYKPTLCKDLLDRRVPNYNTALNETSNFD